ncbi:phosphotransferase family protein [Microbacterium sp. SA39]|uniref:phosphotransferase family protein n=1 Tax=Microbacterium sp. SA39 TaxID=1263625 RepID=UPI0005FA5C32|nr:aminoglycoside phosphotransferase family protein [Microbacterium sp. SA39]
MNEADRVELIAATSGITARTVTMLPGGNQNVVARVQSETRDVVVRFARDPSQAVDPFDIEVWALEAAADAGIHTSAVVARGWAADTSYLVVEYIAGSTASPDDLEAWHAVGTWLRALSTVDTTSAPAELFSRFGRDLDAAWRAHVVYNLAELTDDDPLIELGVYERSDQDTIRAMLASHLNRALPQGLIHGDLSTRNVVSGDRYAVIDWGAAHAGPVPWGDLDVLHRWHVMEDPQSPVSADAWAEVLRGAGIDPEIARPVLRELAVLGAMDVVRWAIAQCPDRLDELRESSRRVIHRMLMARVGRPTPG